MLIDTDTASDDAVAIVMALRDPRINVKAITVVAGNVPVEQAVINALYTTQQCDSDVPVYAGAAKPMHREAADATWFHGKDGMGDQNYPLPKRTAEKLSAIDAISKIIRENEGIELVTLGPLTNIAFVLEQEPRLVNHVSKCVVMGGAACTQGNVTPAAEYNIWCDPEAAQIVFNSGMNIEMVGWELSRGEANLNEADIARIRAINSPLAHFCIDCNRRSLEANKEQSGEIGIPLPDPIAMAIAIDPTLCTRRSTHHVMIETQSELTRGMTIIDRLNVSGDARNHTAWAQAKPVSVCWKMDTDRWKEMLYRSVRGDY